MTRGMTITQRGRFPGRRMLVLLRVWLLGLIALMAIGEQRARGEEPGAAGGEATGADSSSLVALAPVQPDAPSVQPRRGSEEKFTWSPRLSRTERLLFAGEAAGRMMDLVSTHRCLLSPYNREVILPEYVVHHEWLFVLEEGGVGWVEAQGVKWLDRRGHRRLAKVVPVVDMVGVGLTDWSNWRLTTRRGAGGAR